MLYCPTNALSYIKLLNCYKPIKLIKAAEILNAMNNKLLAGGIFFFCDLEKAFDCVNHDILLSTLKCYGISDKDFQLYQSYLGKQLL